MVFHFLIHYLQMDPVYHLELKTLAAKLIIYVSRLTPGKHNMSYISSCTLGTQKMPSGTILLQE